MSEDIKEITNEEKAEKVLEQFKEARKSKPTQEEAKINNEVAKEILKEDEKAKHEIEKLRASYNKIFEVMKMADFTPEQMFHLSVEIQMNAIKNMVVYASNNIGGKMEEYIKKNCLFKEVQNDNRSNEEVKQN